VLVVDLGHLYRLSAGTTQGVSANLDRDVQHPHIKRRGKDACDIDGLRLAAGPVSFGELGHDSIGVDKGLRPTKIEVSRG
jgi:hypothetical protein